MHDLHSVLQDIGRADSGELSQIVRAILTRYETLFPEEELFFLSLPLHDPQERSAILTAFTQQASHKN